MVCIEGEAVEGGVLDGVFLADAIALVVEVAATPGAATAAAETGAAGPAPVGIGCG